MSSFNWSKAFTNAALMYSDPLPLYAMPKYHKDAHPHVKVMHHAKLVNIMTPGTSRDSSRRLPGFGRSPYFARPDAPRASASFAADKSLPPSPPPELTASALLVQVKEAPAQNVDAAEWLTQMTEHGNDDVKKAAVEKVTQEVIPHLVTALKTNGSSAESLVLLALAEHSDTEVSTPAEERLLCEVIPALIERCEEGKVQKFAALEALSQSSNEAVRVEGEQAIEMLAKSGDANVRDHALRVISDREDFQVIHTDHAPTQEALDAMHDFHEITPDQKPTADQLQAMADAQEYGIV